MALFERENSDFGADVGTRALSVTAVENDFVERVYEKLASVYDLTFGPTLHPGRLVARDRMGIRPHDRILEVGVGTGINTSLYPRNCHITGIDLSTSMLEKARERVKREGLRNVRLLEMDALVVDTPDHRLTAETVRAAIDDDPDISDVVAVICTSGTTNAGIVDDLAGVGAVAREHGWWFHVDGAYGGSGIFARSLRPKYNGIEHADSFILDPHKWLFTPFDCCSLLYRDPELARATHTQDASYLDVIHTADGEWNPTDYAYHLTRRARGLPLWFSLAVNGVDAYREAIETAVSLAIQTADLIRATPQLELIREPDLGVVLFRRVGWEPADYDKWAQSLHEEEIAFVPPSKWEGETVGRFAFLHPHTTMDLVREILDRTA